MSKFPLDWHRKGLNSSEIHLARAEAELERVTENVERTRNYVEFMRRQIAEAERQGLDGYDPERFMVNRKTKKPA